MASIIQRAARERARRKEVATRVLQRAWIRFQTFRQTLRERREASASKIQTAYRKSASAWAARSLYERLAMQEEDVSVLSECRKPAEHKRQWDPSVSINKAASSREIVPSKPATVPKMRQKKPTTSAPKTLSPRTRRQQVPQANTRVAANDEKARILSEQRRRRKDAEKRMREKQRQKEAEDAIKKEKARKDDLNRRKRIRILSRSA